MLRPRRRGDAWGIVQRGLGLRLASAHLLADLMYLLAGCGKLGGVPERLGEGFASAGGL